MDTHYEAHNHSQRGAQSLATRHSVSTRTKKNRRDAIVAAAQEVFARKGRDGATIGEIAHTAGCSPSVIYKYFKNKRELHDISMGHYFDDMLAILEDTLPFEVSLPDHLRWMLGRFFKLFSENTALIRTALVHESMGEEGYEQRRRLGLQMESLFAAAIERGELRPGDPKKYSTAFGGITNMWILNSLVEENVMPGPADIEDIVDLFMRGAGAPQGDE